MRILTRRDTGLLTQWTFGRSAFEDETIAFLNATGISDATTANAINTFIVSSKLDGTWETYIAAYPFVGTTATTQSFNLKDPKNASTSFRLAFVGGWTHSSNGALPNGVNAYAETYIIPNNVFSGNSAHINYYSRTNSAVVSEIPMGVLNSATGGSGLNLVIRRSTNLNSFRATEAAGATGLVDSTSLDSRGLTSGSITSSTSRKLYKNGVLLNTNSSNITFSRAFSSMYIGAAFTTDLLLPAFYTNKECAFASISSGLTDTQVANTYTNIQALQTALSRQV
jgi:hypothetical protein